MSSFVGKIKEQSIGTQVKLKSGKQPVVKTPRGSSSFVSLDLEEGSFVIDVRKQL